MAMISRRPRFKILLLLSLLVLISAGAGFFAGVSLATAINKKKENPFFWKQTAMKQLQKLHPPEAQRKKFETIIDHAVKDLVELRKQGIKDVWEVVDHAAQEIDPELSAEQRKTFDKIKPKAPAEAK